MTAHEIIVHRMLNHLYGAGCVARAHDIADELLADLKAVGYSIILVSEMDRLRRYAGPGPYEPSDADGAKAPTWQELRDLADHNFRLYAHAQAELERLLAAGVR